MKLTRCLGSFAALCFLIAACEERDLPIGEDPGGSGGDAGAGMSPGNDGGTAQNGGTAGSPTFGGTGGSSSGGTGEEPLGGGGATGGTGTMTGESGGTAGAGPECDPDEPLPQLDPVDFSHCEEPPLTMEGSTCTEEATREALRCGEPGSPHGADCCVRQRCKSDADCGEDSRCLPRVVQRPDNLEEGATTESCETYCSLEGVPSCRCTTTDDFDLNGYCVGIDEGIERFECDLRGRSCDDLEMWAFNLESFFTDPRYEPAPRDTTIAACAEKVAEALAQRCDACDCTVEETDAECTAPLASVCPAGNGCALEAMRQPDAICELDASRAVYSECDDGTVRFAWTEGNENDYRLAYHAASFQRTFGYASGYVGRMCGLSGQHTAVITAGTPPDESASCVSCNFCPGSWDGEDEPPPDCARDDDGRISLP